MNEKLIFEAKVKISLRIKRPSDENYSLPRETEVTLHASSVEEIISKLENVMEQDVF